MPKPVDEGVVALLSRELREVRKRELQCMVGPDAVEAAAAALRRAGGDPREALKGLS